MRRTLVKLCRVGVLIPPLLTEGELVILLVLMAVVPLRTHSFSIPTFATLSLMAASLGFSLLKVFRHLWATIVAAAVISVMAWIWHRNSLRCPRKSRKVPWRRCSRRSFLSDSPWRNRSSLLVSVVFRRETRPPPYTNVRKLLGKARLVHRSW